MTVCRECSTGIHTHLEIMSLPEVRALTKFELIDSIDCKNVIGPGDQCVCPMWVYAKERILTRRR